jgi:hypothetical protein
MKASVVDLRYKMNEVIKALEKREKVTILYHGKVKGVIWPAVADQSKKVAEHPFFNMAWTEKKSVAEHMKELRGPRFNAV